MTQAYSLLNAIHPVSFLRKGVAALVLVLAGLAPIQASAQDVIASSGEDFYIALPWLVLASSPTFRVSITASKPCDVTVTFTELERDTTKFLLAGERWDLVIRRDDIILDPVESTSRRSLHITSTAPITVSALYDAPYLADAFCALPSQLLGFEYFAITHPTDTSHFEGVIAVIATADETTIRITPTAQTAGSIPGGTYARILQKGEVYQILPASARNTDLTGTRIRSDKPIAVIAGHRGAMVAPIDALNSIVEQMVPVVDWGTTFYSTPLPGSDTGYYRVFSARAGTEVFANGRRIATLGAGQSRFFISEGNVKIEATAPVSIVQYTIHFVAPKGLPNSDPSMMMLNPVESYATSFLWGTPSIPARLDLGDTSGAVIAFEHYVQITAPSSAVSTVRLDGRPVTFPLAQPDGLYSTAIVRVTPGGHRLTAQAPINAQLFGYSHFDAYSLPAGMRLRDPFRGEPLFARTCRSSIDTTLTLTNVGVEQIDIASITFSPGISGTVISPTFYPFPVLANSSTQLRVRIDLPGYGAQSGRIIVQTTTTGGRPLEIPIEISRDSLAVDIVEPPVRFRNVSQQNPLSDSVITLVNSGTGPTTISNVTFTGPFRLLSPDLPITLAPGDTARLLVRFAPPTAGEFSGRLIVFQTTCGLPDTLTLSGYRLRPAGIVTEVGAGGSLLCPDPGDLDIPLTITNPGEEPLRIDSLELRGVAPDDYSVIDPHRGLVVPGGTSLVIMIRFRPTRTGDRPADIRVWNSLSAGGYLLASITARKDSVALVPSPEGLEFDPTTGCEQSPPRQIELRNSGTVPLKIDSLRFAQGEFRLDGAAPASIAPGGTTTISVLFDPRGSGLRFDTLHVYGDRCDLVAAIPLRGEQRGASLGADVDTVDFGLIPACTLPVTRTIRLINTGTVPERITGIGVDAPGFALSLIDSLLTPGEESTVEILFTGNGGNLYEATVTVTADPCALERRIFIRARAELPELLPIDDIDLGAVGPGQPQRGRTILRNGGTIPLTVDSITFLPQGDRARVASPGVPFTLRPGEQMEVEIEYTLVEGEVIDLQATAHVGTPCPLRVGFRISGEQREELTLVLRLPDTSATVDDRLALPIEILASREFADTIIIDGIIGWDVTALAGDGLSTPIAGGRIERTIDSIAGGVRHTGFRYTGPVPARGILAYLPVLTLLGTTDTTSLRFVVLSASPRIAGIPVTIRGEDGGLRTLGICRIGGDRFIRLGGASSMTRIAPNPMRDASTVELVLPVDAAVTLRIHDPLGRSWTLFSGDLPAGTHRISIERSDLPSGFYQLELESKGRRSWHELILAR